MAILSKDELERYRLEKYQYGIDVQKRHQLYGMSGKLIHEGRWRSGRTDPVIIVEMNEAISEREARFYLEVNGHDNIIRTLGYVENSLNLTIFIQEFAAFNDLAGILMDNQFNISQMILVEMFAQIADAMSYVASKHIVHGDLGCRNVLVFRVDPDEPKNNLVKITDFGLARWIEHPPANEDPSVLPIRYCASEILRNNRHSSYSEKSDVYSMGVLIWEALSNSEIPFSSIADDENVKQKKLNNERLSRPQVCDRQLWKLMNECWDNNRKHRPTFELIKEKLSIIEVSDATDVRSSVSIHELPEHYKYELNVDVKMNALMHGYFGKTYEAEWVSKRERPVVLVMIEQELSKHEATVYNDFDPHKYIIHTFGFVENNQGLTLLLQERAPYNNLQTLLSSGQFQPSAKVLVTIFLQIVEAMVYVASQGIVHGDLRCGNILVFQMNSSEPTENLVKLANFSLARGNDPSFVDDRRLTVPVRYCALEILRSAGRSNYSELSDVYSMGVLMWEACSKGKVPYESSVTIGEVRQRKLNGEKLSRPLMCNNQMWSIMEDCWLNEPALRYNFEEMKTRLSQIDLGSIETYQYELNKNVKQKRSLNGTNGRFYEVDWIPNKDPPIILLVIDGPTAEHEASLYIKLNSHPHIIHTFGLVNNDRQLVMLLQERALYGNLQTLLQSGNFEPLPKALVAIFLQIVDAMIYISGQGIVHGDLRCANVLVFQTDASEPTRNLVKLTNFNLVRSKDQSITNNRTPDGYIRYCAPEILRSGNGSNYSQLSDVYSMGILMWQGCSKGEVPYGHRTSDDDVRQQKLNHQNLSQPNDCHSQIWSVIEGCCPNEPDLRYTFEQLKTQLGKVNVNIIDCEMCDRCKQNIPKNGMSDHQKRCGGNPRVDDRSAPRSVHFTRCSYCGERCLGSELEEHQRTCPHRLPPPTCYERRFSVRCDYCGQDFGGNEIIHHQDSCQARATPPLDFEPLRLTRCDHCDKEYLDSEIADHMKTCSRRPKTPIPQKQCIHCHRQYPLTEIQTHEISCPQKPPPRVPQPPPTPAPGRPCTYCHRQYPLTEIQTHETRCPSRPIIHVSPSPEPIPHKECRYCHRQYPSANIKHHESSCPQQPPPPVPLQRPAPVANRPCTYCYRPYPLTTIAAHEETCPSKPKSFMDQLHSWVCCCCEK